MKHSQNDEERIALRYFGERMGAFMDLGANDGETLSNTRALALRGWGGLCVDASPRAFDKLRRLYADRTDVDCLHAAIWEANGSIVLHESGSHLSAADVGLVSSLDKEETERWVTEEFNEVRVPAITVMDAILRSQHKRFDLVSIDIEGVDLMALQQMDLGAMGCSMLIVEVNDRGIAPYIEHCAEHGLSLIHRNAENLIFAR